MGETTTNLDLDALRRLADAATPGPWTAEYVYHLKHGCRCLSCHEDEPYGKAIHELDGRGEDPSPILSEPDADFIAAARTAIPELIAEVERMLRAVDTTRAVAQSNKRHVGYLTRHVEELEAELERYQARKDIP